MPSDTDAAEPQASSLVLQAAHSSSAMAWTPICSERSFISCPMHGPETTHLLDAGLHPSKPRVSPQTSLQLHTKAGRAPQRPGMLSHWVPGTPLTGVQRSAWPKTEERRAGDPSSDSGRSFTLPSSTHVHEGAIRIIHPGGRVDLAEDARAGEARPVICGISFAPVARGKGDRVLRAMTGRLLGERKGRRDPRNPQGRARGLVRI